MVSSSTAGDGNTPHHLRKHRFVHTVHGAYYYYGT